MRQENKDQEKLLLSWMHNPDVNIQPSCALPSAVPKVMAGDTGQGPARVGVSSRPPPLPLPPSLVQVSPRVPKACCVHQHPKATPAVVTMQPSCSVPCREDEEEPNLIYSVLHFHAK